LNSPRSRCGAAPNLFSPRMVRARHAHFLNANVGREMHQGVSQFRDLVQQLLILDRQIFHVGKRLERLLIAKRAKLARSAQLAEVAWRKLALDERRKAFGLDQAILREQLKRRLDGDDG